MSVGNATFFESEIPLPDKMLLARATRLVGFGQRYEKLRRDLRLLIEKDGLEQWSKKLYGTRIALLDTLDDRYPLVIFYGDVGTGKTATAEAAANALATELRREAMLFKLSTRVRGSGNVGEMSMLINRAFDVIAREAGKAKLSFLIIDEADSLASSRSAQQSHHEDKVAVNTLIQKIDDSRRFAGRVLVILCTNRFEALDPAIVRRSAFREEFKRPNDAERRELLTLDCQGLGLSEPDLDRLVRLTGPDGPHGLTYTFSDIRTRLLPEALAQAYPDRKITAADFEAAASRVAPSPAIDGLRS